MRSPRGPVNYNAFIGLTWRHLFLLWHNPLKFTQNMAQRYGDIAFYRIFAYRAYQVNHPALIYEILVSKSKHFAKLSQPLGAIRKFVGEGLITSEGETWRRQRLLMQPGFNNTAAQHVANIAVDEVTKMLARWANRTTVKIDEEMSGLMVRTISRWLFDFLPEGKQGDELTEAMTVVSATLHSEMPNPFNLPDWMPLPGKRRKRRAFQLLNSFVAERIARARKVPPPSNALMGMLLRAVDQSTNGEFTDEHVKNELIMLFFAGHHTAAACLVWTLYLLDRHPDISANLQSETDAVLEQRLPAMTDIPQLKLAEMVIKESMRLYPPAWALFTRQILQDVQIGDYLLPAGSLVFIYPWIVHRDQRFYPDPERFRPERFASDAPEIPSGAYIPFGLGPHSCIGGRIASTVLMHVLPSILQRFQLRVMNEVAPTLQATLSLRPRGDILMQLVPRDVRGAYTARGEGASATIR